MTETTKNRKPNIFVIPAAPLENVQLLKDRMVIPYVYYRHFGGSLTIVTKKKEDYPYLSYLPGAELAYLEYEDGDNYYTAAYAGYILENYSIMDIIFLFGPYPQYTYLVSAYKKLRPDGKVYLKLDANSGWMDWYDVYQEPYFSFLSGCDVISCESLRLQSLLSKKWPWRIEYIPNGCYFPLIPSHDVCFEKKKNIILTVGRIGTKQKNNEMLMEAFAKVSGRLSDWSLRAVGNVTPEFEGWMAAYFERYPHLRERVTLTGPVFDKEELFREYGEAKVFALTSRMEGGSPNVFAEAAISGCAVIVTDVDACDDMTDRGRLGEIVQSEDTHGFAQALVRLCGDEPRLEYEGRENIRYIRNHFDYDRVVKRLALLFNLS